jgi:hypothetical protein
MPEYLKKVPGDSKELGQHIFRAKARRLAGAKSKKEKK